MLRTTVGYTGGSKANPTYHSLGDHSEAIEIAFDPAVITYEELLEVFWREHDPTRPAYSIQYRSAIFVHDAEQRRLAEASLLRTERERGKKLHTAILTAGRFTDAEDYHQKYTLRSRRKLVAWLAESYGDPAWTRTTLAARLIGFVGSDTTRDEVLSTARTLGVPATHLARLETLLE